MHEVEDAVVGAAGAIIIAGPAIMIVRVTVMEDNPPTITSVRMTLVIVVVAGDILVISTLILVVISTLISVEISTLILVKDKQMPQITSKEKCSAGYLKDKGELTKSPFFNHQRKLVKSFFQNRAHMLLIQHPYVLHIFQEVLPSVFVMQMI